MEKNIRAVLPKIRNSVLAFVALFFSIQSSEAYYDQVVVEMPNTVKTVYDIRVHSFFRHLYENQTVVDTTKDSWIKDNLEIDRENYVEQFLVQNYVLENDLPLRPSTEDVEKIIKQMNKPFKNEADKKKHYDVLNITAEDAHEWVTNRLTMDHFLDDMQKNRVILSDDKLQEFYNTWKNDRFKGKSFGEVETTIKNELGKMLLSEEFQKWTDQEKRSRKLILKTLQKT